MTGPRTRWAAFAAIALAAAVVSCAHAERQGAAAGPPSGPSIYDLDLPMIDQDGKTLTLADLRGDTIVAAMMYASCTSVCPRVTEDMKSIERRLTSRDKQGVRFVLFSLDPGRDTPAALRRFAAEHQLDPARWRLFAASEDDVLNLSAVLGVKYRREDNGEIAHSAMIFVIDRGGVVRHRQVGMTDDVKPLVDALTKARL